MYSLRALPIGGFCMLGGENESTGDLEGDFVSKKWWQKVLVLAAGATMNFILCILIMASISLIVGTVGTTLDKISPASPAEAAGIEAGDKILEINGAEITGWQDVIDALYQYDGEVAFKLERDGETIEKSVTTVRSEDDTHYVVGITPAIEHRPLYSLKIGAQASWEMAVMMVDAIKTLIIGQGSMDDLSGPVGIVTVVNQTANMGFMYVAYLAAIISLNLGIMNLLPFPALDGGRILFVLIRLFTGKAVSDELESKFHFVGMALLMVLLVVVTFNDIGRFIIK